MHQWSSLPNPISGGIRTAIFSYLHGMNTPTCYRTRSAARGTRHYAPQTTIRRYFRAPQRQSPGTIVDAPCDFCMELGSAASRSATLPHGTPAAFQTDMDEHTQSQYRLDADLRTLLRALPTRADIEVLPTRADIESLILCIEEAHSRDIQEVRTELHL